jgi:membrane protein
MVVKLQFLRILIAETVSAWVEDKAPRLGAALAYYTVFSIAPLIIIAITIAGLVFANVQEQVMREVQNLVGVKGREMIESMVDAAHKPATTAIATILGVVTLLIGASGVFIQLKDALNTIWKATPKRLSGIVGFTRNYLQSFSVILGIGFLLLVSLLLSAALAAGGEYMRGLFPGAAGLMKTLSFIVSFGIVSCLFAMIFKLLPDVRVSWHDVWIGALLTAFLFVVGKFALGFYLGNAKIGSAYGAAGSLVLILLWVYYSSQILFLGAEFTWIYANFCGSRAAANPRSFLPAGKKLKSRKEVLVAQNEHRRRELDLMVKKFFGLGARKPWRIARREKLPEQVAN